VQSDDRRLVPLERGLDRLSGVLPALFGVAHGLTLSLGSSWFSKIHLLYTFYLYLTNLY
jgi:hypothetical protein